MSLDAATPAVPEPAAGAGKREPAVAKPEPTEQGQPAAPPADPRAATHQVTIYRSWCKGCGICVAFCPKEVYAEWKGERPEVLHPERCTGCQQCVLHCPDFAIRVDAIAPRS